MHEINRIIARLCMLNQSEKLLNNDRLIAEWNEHYFKRLDTTVYGKKLKEEIKKACSEFNISDIPSIISMILQNGAKVEVANRSEHKYNLKLNYDPLRIELINTVESNKLAVWTID